MSEQMARSTRKFQDRDDVTQAHKLPSGEGRPPSTWYALHALGRTIPGLRPSVLPGEIEELMRELGIWNRVNYYWNGLSDAQRLETLATEILMEDRRERREVLRILGEAVPQFGGEGYSILSPWQAKMRTDREVSLGMFPPDHMGIRYVWLERILSQWRGRYWKREDRRLVMEY